ncbi:UDP-N-acetylmuramoyl-tripeptide--D-alanyl-D-alanine ligase [Candidatus Berkelbacteria bacterium]|nr:UDP-N-acetylmuramoyl-tripeptide--D-alanyl-D-alanine ligase [Candidatus Berkelbacteria bacterium]
MNYFKARFKYLVESILSWSAKRVLRIRKPFIIGVTGTAGKTTTKSAISHVLAKVLEQKVRSAPGNLNTEIGLPLAILDLEAPVDPLGWVRVLINAVAQSLFTFSPKGASEVLVLEYGIDQPGDMKKLLKIAQPKIGILTNIGSAHTQFLKTVEAVAKEKSQLVTSLPKSGLAVLNKRDRRVIAYQGRTKARVELVDRPADEFALAVAILVAEHGFGVSAKEALKAGGDWQRPPGRLRIFDGVKGSVVIDDTYNANPISTTLALDQLKRISRDKKGKRSIVVLGDMLELGKEEFKAHKGIALLAQRVADEVVLVGTRFRRVVNNKTTWFPGPMPAASYILSLVKKGDIILVKGSQSMRMEKIVEVLLKNKKDSALLVRQSPYWKNKQYLTP